MHWVASGLCLFGFSAPAAVLGSGFAIGATGCLLGPLITCLTTWSSARGALMLLDLVTYHPEAKTFADLGYAVLGPVGEWFGFLAQQGNFFLFLPVALLTCAQGVQGAVDPLASWLDGCMDYWIFIVAFLCLATTQLRSLENVEALAFVSLFCIFVVIVLVIVIISTNRIANDYDEDENDNINGPKQLFLFGNADMRHGDSDQRFKGWCTFFLGLSMASWSYVPSFLTVELISASRNHKKPSKSLASKAGDEISSKTGTENFAGAVWLSAGLNVFVVVGVGLFVALSWGSDVADPLTLGTDSRPSSWPAESIAARALNVFWFIANAISYALDSVPLSGNLYRMWRMRHESSHEATTMIKGRKAGFAASKRLQFFLVSIPPWFFAVVLAVIVPSLFCMLAIVTAITVPVANNILPSIFYYAWLNGNGTHANIDSSGDAAVVFQATPDSSNLTDNLIPSSFEDDTKNAGKSNNNIPVMTKWRLLDVAVVSTIGFAMLVVCSVAAIGKVALSELRGPLIIGCNGWLLYSSTTAG